MTKILFVSCRQRHPAANRLKLPRSTKHANPCSKSLQWADIEQGRRGAASAMLAQHAKWSLLILYAFAGFLSGKLSKVSATSLCWIDPTTRALIDACTTETIDDDEHFRWVCPDLPISTAGPLRPECQQ
jgi:hypothetical protein